MRMDGSRIRKAKVADPKISGNVWTGPKKKTGLNHLNPYFISTLRASA